MASNTTVCVPADARPTFYTGMLRKANVRKTTVEEPVQTGNGLVRSRRWRFVRSVRQALDAVQSLYLRREDVSRLAVIHLIIADHAIALACLPLQTFAVQNVYFAAPVVNQAELL